MSTKSIGLHLSPAVSEPDARRQSVLAALDRDAKLVRLERLDSDEAIAAAVGVDGAVVCVDQPLVVANMQGQRRFEHLLSWCDAPTFPIALGRLRTLYGGARGVAIAGALLGHDLTLAEALPDLTIRQLIWEHEHPEGIDLETYRSRWLGVRAPRYRPKGIGRARPAGFLPTCEILARVVDTAGWTPPSGSDDWEAIACAAELDAIVCAYTAWRARYAEDAHRTVRCADGAFAIIATGPNLAERLEIHAERLGDVVIGTLPPVGDTPRTPA